MGIQIRASFEDAFKYSDSFDDPNNSAMLSLIDPRDLEGRVIREELVERLKEMVELLLTPTQAVIITRLYLYNEEEQCISDIALYLGFTKRKAELCKDWAVKMLKENREPALAHLANAPLGKSKIAFQNFLY